MYRTKLDADYICENLMRDKKQIPREIREGGYRQLSLFDKEICESFQLPPEEVVPVQQQITAI